MAATIDNDRGAPFNIVWRLAMADLAHEKWITACMALAIAAVVSPILLIFGLKHGAIQTLRDRLAGDPTNLEVTANEDPTAPFSMDWFESMKRHPAVGFIVPRRLSIYDQITHIPQHPGAEEEVSITLIPSGEGDPELMAAGIGKFPTFDTSSGRITAIANAPAAYAMQVSAGDILEFQCDRRKDLNSMPESHRLRIRIVATLPGPRRGSERLFVDPSLAEAVMKYRTWLPTPEFGVTADESGVRPAFDGAIVLTDVAIDREDEISLTTTSKFGQLAPFEMSEMERSRFPDHVDRFPFRYRLLGPPGEVYIPDFASLVSRLSDRRAMVMPWMAPMSANLTDARGHTEWSGELKAHRFVEVEDIPDRVRRPFQLHFDSRKATANDAKEFTLIREGAATRISLPVSVNRSEFGLMENSTFAFLDGELLGRLRLADKHAVRFHAPDYFTIQHPGFTGFRLYAASIDSVETVAQLVEDKGVSVFTQAREIEQVQQLNRYLGLTFSFIAAVGLVGTAGSLVANSLSAVRRKTRDLALLRLVGIEGWRLDCFPVYQSFVIGCLGFVLAVAVFAAGRPAIDLVFSSHLGDGESFCRLPISLIVAFGVGLLTVTVASSLLAVGHVRKIDPAESIRQE